MKTSRALAILSALTLPNAFGLPYSDWLRDQHESNDPCGLLGIPKTHMTDRQMLDTCITVCRTSGPDAAYDLGCLSPTEAISSGFYRGDGILDWTIENTMVKTWTPADCANACYKDDGCVYWQFGPFYYPDDEIVSASAVLCGHAKLNEFADIQGVGDMGLYKDGYSGKVDQVKCDDQFINFFHHIDVYYEDSDEEARSKSRIGGFLNQDPIDNNCDTIHGIARTTTTTTTITTTTTATPMTTPTMPGTESPAPRAATDSGQKLITRSTGPTATSTSENDCDADSDDSTTEDDCDPETSASSTTSPCEDPHCGAKVNVDIHVEIN